MRKKQKAPFIKFLGSAKEDYRFAPDELRALLMLTPHPEIGAPPWWRVDILISEEDSATVVALVDPLILEICSLNLISLRKFLKRLLRDLQDQELIPAYGKRSKYKFKIKIKRKKKKVLGTLLLGRKCHDEERHTHQDDCPFCPLDECE